MKFGVPFDPDDSHAGRAVPRVVAKIPYPNVVLAWNMTVVSSILLGEVEGLVPLSITSQILVPAANWIVLQPSLVRQRPANIDVDHFTCCHHLPPGHDAESSPRSIPTMQAIGVCIQTLHPRLRRGHRRFGSEVRLRSDRDGGSFRDQTFRPIGTKPPPPQPAFPFGWGRATTYPGKAP